jgi:hypothetical protein
MADAVTSQTLLDGERLAVMKFTNISDGTGESAVLKVDVSALASNASGKACTGVKIEKASVSINGMAVSVLWDATTDVVATVLAPGVYDFCFDPALPNNAGAGVTGDVLFTTIGHTSGDTYAIILTMVKVYG